MGTFIICINGLLKQNKCGLWEGKWGRHSREPLGLCSTAKVVRGFLNTKEKFKFEQEIVADLKILNLKSDLKDEVKSIDVT